MSDPSLAYLAPPPRQVPLPLRCQIMFGGGFNQLGWIVLLFGTGVFWSMGFNSEFFSLFTFRGPMAAAAGLVTASENTGVSVGGSKRRKGTPVFANHFSFKAADGLSVHGVSYATGRQLPAGQPVAVEYCLDNPAACRIQGMRSRLFGYEAMAVLIVPLAGVGLLLPGFLRGRRASRLLAGGLLGEAVLKSKEPTRTKVNKQTVYKLCFGFKATDGKEYDLTVKTHRPQWLEDEHQEKLIYDPAHPGGGILVDYLPGTFFVDSHGQLQPGSSRSALLATLVPTITVLGNAIYAFSRFLG